MSWRKGEEVEYHAGTYDGRILGDDTLADEVLSKARQHTLLKYTCEDVVNIVCRNFKISAEELRSPGKSRHYSEARAVAALIVRETSHLSITNLARLLDRDVSALGRSVLHIKEMAEGAAGIAACIEEIRAELECPKP